MRVECVGVDVAGREFPENNVAGRRMLIQPFLVNHRSPNHREGSITPLTEQLSSLLHSVLKSLVARLPAVSL